MTQEEMQALAELLKPINEHLKNIDKRLERIEEDGKVTRTSTNLLVEWAEESGKMQGIPFPVKKQA